MIRSTGRLVRPGLILLILAYVGFLSGCSITNLQQVDVESLSIQQAVRITDSPEKGQMIARGIFL